MQQDILLICKSFHLTIYWQVFVLYFNPTISSTYKHYYKVISQGNGKLVAYTPCLKCHDHSKLTGLRRMYVGIGPLVCINNLLSLLLAMFWWGWAIKANYGQLADGLGTLRTEDAVGRRRDRKWFFQFRMKSACAWRFLPNSRTRPEEIWRCLENVSCLKQNTIINRLSQLFCQLEFKIYCLFMG